MPDADNPLGREYTKAEIAAARRRGVALMKPTADGGKVLSGPLIWATGPYWPEHARERARDWALISAALDREWAKGEDDD